MSTESLEKYNTETLQFDDGMLTLTYDEYGYIRYMTAIDKKESVRIEVNRYYNNLIVQVWGHTGDTKLIRITFEFEFKDGEKAFPETIEEYRKYKSIKDVSDDWLIFLKDYIINLGSE
jgi:hypothetical protein